MIHYSFRDFLAVFKNNSMGNQVIETISYEIKMMRLAKERRDKIKEEK